VKLLDLIDPNVTFISELEDAGCITSQQREHLNNIGQRRGIVDTLLEFLKRRSVADFKKFTNSLAKYQPQLVPLLETGDGKVQF